MAFGITMSAMRAPTKRGRDDDADQYEYSCAARKKLHLLEQQQHQQQQQQQGSHLRGPTSPQSLAQSRRRSLLHVLAAPPAEPLWASLARSDDDLVFEFAMRPIQLRDRDNVSFLQWVSAYAALAMRPLHGAMAQELALAGQGHWAALAPPWPKPDEESERHAQAMQRFLQLRKISQLNNFFVIGYDQWAADTMKRILCDPRAQDLL